MDMRTYFILLRAEEKISFAKKLGTSVPYLSQIAHGHRKAGPKIACAIEKETSGKVKRADLRPDIFGPLADAGQEA